MDTCIEFTSNLKCSLGEKRLRSYESDEMIQLFLYSFFSFSNSTRNVDKFYSQNGSLNVESDEISAFVQHTIHTLAFQWPTGFRLRMLWKSSVRWYIQWCVIKWMDTRAKSFTDYGETITILDIWDLMIGRIMMWSYICWAGIWKVGHYYTAILYTQNPKFASLHSSVTFSL